MKKMTFKDLESPKRQKMLACHNLMEYQHQVLHQSQFQSLLKWEKT